MGDEKQSGFTLIEMSIVLVIVGLIVGGVLAGQDLIRASYVRAQISQIERYNTAVNTFYAKYGALPGDINAAAAQANGFAARGTGRGEGDGNGILEGAAAEAGGGQPGTWQGGGETQMFWSDMTYANGMNINLIDGIFSNATPTPQPVNAYYIYASGTPNLSNFFPAAKIGNSNYIYVWSMNGVNYYGLSAVSALDNLWDILSNCNIPVRAAYNIDKKVDDGFPESGNVLAVYVSQDPFWANPGQSNNYVSYGYIDTTPTNASAATCYDNGGNSANVMAYSTAYNGGSAGTCGLSFRMQGGD